MIAASLVLGVVVVLGMMLAFLPLLGWMNWGVIPVAIIGLVISIIATAMAKEKKGAAIAGIILCAIAVFGCSICLIINGGIY